MAAICEIKAHMHDRWIAASPFVICNYEYTTSTNLSLFFGIFQMSRHLVSIGPAWCNFNHRPYFKDVSADFLWSELHSIAHRNLVRCPVMKVHDEQLHCPCTTLCSCSERNVPMKAGRLVSAPPVPSPPCTSHSAHATQNEFDVNSLATKNFKNLMETE